MLKARVIPCLDVKDGRTVKGINFVELRDAGDPVEQAKLYDAQGADELCLLDITASHENRNTIIDVVRKVASECFMPLTVGGGVRTIEDVRNLLLAGADKVAINTAAIKNPEFVKEAANKFGSQCIVVAIDAKKVIVNSNWISVFILGYFYSVLGKKHSSSHLQRGFLTTYRIKIDKRNTTISCPKTIRNYYSDGKFEIFTHGGRKETGIDAVEFAKKVVEYGAGEILLTSMDRDGTKVGFNIALTKAVSDAVTVPVIASGGAGKLGDFAEGIKEGKASAVLAASLFHFGECTVSDVKQDMREKGIDVRL